MRTAAYKWNGFGFTGINDKKVCDACEQYYKTEMKVPDSLILEPQERRDIRYICDE